MSVTVNLPPTLVQVTCLLQWTCPLHCPSHMSVTVNLPPTLSKSHVCYSEPAPYPVQVTSGECEKEHEAAHVKSAPTPGGRWLPCSDHNVADWPRSHADGGKWCQASLWRCREDPGRCNTCSHSSSMFPVVVYLLSDCSWCKSTHLFVQVKNYLVVCDIWLRCQDMFK